MENNKTEDVNNIKSVAYKKTVEALLSEIERKSKSDPESVVLNLVLEEILALSDLLGEVVERALDLLDNAHIKIFRSLKTGREIFEIEKSHKLFPKLPFCSCRSFCNQVVQGEEFCCKHFLATQIAHALNKVEVVELADEEFRKIIKEIRF